MKTTFQAEDEHEAKILIHASEAFGLLWDINQKLRSYEKNDTDKTKDEIIEELREMIWEDNILNFYN